MKPGDMIVEETLTQQIAALLFQRTTKKEICNRLKISAHNLNKIMDSELFKSLMKYAGDRCISDAQATFRGALENLSRLSVTALEKQLEENNSIEAVKVVVKLAGAALEKTDDGKSEGTIIVNFPAPIQPAKDVKSEVVDASS